MVSLGKKIIVYGLCSILGSPFMVLPSTSFAAPAGTPSKLTVYHGGTIYTMTESVDEVAKNIEPKRAAVVVVNETTGKIEKVFQSEKDAQTYLKDTTNKIVDLGNNIMLPGFIDPHGHFPAAPDYTSINLAPSPIGDVNTIEQIQDRLLEKINERNYAKEGINYVEGSSYDDTLLEVKRHPYHTELSGKGELENYYIKVSHISGHLATLNTKALARFFEKEYYNSKEFKAAIYLDPESDNITDAKLVEKDGKIFYQVTINGSQTKELPGILMQPNALETFRNGEKNVKTYLACMTGTFVEQAMMYIVNLPTDKKYQPNMDEVIGLASKEYASRGVTTSMQGGTILAQAIPQAQKGLLDNKLKIRTIVQPMVYSVIAPEITEASVINHRALVWENINTAGATDDERSLGNPKAGVSPSAGSDVSAWYPGDMMKGCADAGPGKDKPDTLANQVYQKQQANEIPVDRVFLGSWKLIYDGSNQGYTGFFGQHGYYQLPEGDVTYFAVGRTGDEHNDPEGVKINNLGMTSIDDAKNFIKAGNHYGNQGLFLINSAQDVFKLGATTFKRYHEKGQSVHCHLNGSRASSDGLTFIELAVAASPNVKDGRHTIIHAQMQELVETQRLAGNYDQFPLRYNDEAKLQEICTVWQGTAAMTWVPDEKQIVKSYEGYDPEEGHYAPRFSEEALALRQQLKNGQLMKEQNLISSYFVDHTYYWGERHRDIFMGPGSAYNMSPMGWAVKVGHRFTMHNDTPVVPQNPLKSITIATTRLSSGYQAGGIQHAQEPLYSVGAGKDSLEETKEYYPTKKAEEQNGPKRKYAYFDQRITVLQALHALTVNSAWETKGLENKIGKIAEGYYADFVILAQNPFELEKQGEAGLLQIANIPVVATIVGGETVHGFLPGAGAGEFVENLEVSFHQDRNITVSNIKEDVATDAEEKAMQDAAAKNFYGYKKFTATVDNGKTATFSMQVMGNNATVGSLEVMKLLDTTGKGTRSFEFVDKVDLTEGKFFVTDRTLEKPLKATETMKAGQAYYIHFSITDGGVFDADGKPNGTIQDPTFVSTDASFPVEPVAGNGGYVPPADSDSGCTVGTNPHYDFVVLFMGALGLLVVRIMRRREQN